MLHRVQISSILTNLNCSNEMDFTLFCTCGCKYCDSINSNSTKWLTQPCSSATVNYRSTLHLDDGVKQIAFAYQVLTFSSHSRKNDLIHWVPLSTNSVSVSIRLHRALFAFSMKIIDTNVIRNNDPLTISSLFCIFSLGTQYNCYAMWSI